MSFLQSNFNGTPFDSSGFSVSGIGDFNGDGFQDFIVGQPGVVSYTNYADPVPAGAGDGGAAVVFGSANGLPQNVDLATLSPTQGFRITGLTGSKTGFSVAGIGDINGDGYSDLLIGAPDAETRTYTYNRFFSIPNPIPTYYGGTNYSYITYTVPYYYSTTTGANFVVFGSAAPDVGANNVLDLGASSPDVLTITGLPSGGFSTTGDSVSAVGDFGGDGLSDFAIFSRSYLSGTGGFDYQPRVLVFSGETTPVLYQDLQYGASSEVTALSGQGLFRNRLAYSFARDFDGGGDFDGDGLADMIVSATGFRETFYTTYGASYLGVNVGAAVIFFGDSARVGGTIQAGELDGTNGFVVVGEQAYAGFGQDVANIGDINGDGLDDFLIGSSNYDRTLTQTYTFTGTYGSILTGTYTTSVFRAGAAFVVLGQEGGLPGGEISTADLHSGLGFAVLGEGRNAQLGTALGAVGDVNGDGFDDFAVLSVSYPSESEFTYDPYAIQPLVHVIFGAANLPDVLTLSDLDGSNGFTIALEQANFATNQYTANGNTYTRTVNLGLRPEAISGTDSDGDGFSDILVGWSRSREIPGYSAGPTYDGMAPILYQNRAILFAGGSNERWAAIDALDGATDGMISAQVTRQQFVLGDITDDELTGTSENDTIIGLGGNDSIRGGRGDDEARGGAGDDAYRFTFATEGSLTVFETSGEDQLEVFESDLSDLSFRRSSADLVVEQAGTTGKVTIKDFFGAAGARVEYLDTRDASVILKTNLTGTAADEVFVGSSASQEYYAGGGDDVIFAGGGDDTLRGQAGNDVLHGQEGNDNYVVDLITDGSDVIYETGGQDNFTAISGVLERMSFRRSSTDLVIEQDGATGKVVVADFYGSAGARIETLTTTNSYSFLRANLTGTASSDVLVGTSADEIISGGAGQDLIASGGGNDVLTGGVGNDVLRGGAGNDTYRFAFATDEEDFIVETSGTDTLQVLDRAIDDVDFRRSGTDLVLESGGTTGKVVITDFYGAAGARVEFLQTTDTTLTLKTDLIGTAGNEVFVGTSASQSIDAGAGNDVVIGGGGNDTLTGGAGNDTLEGGTGNDRVAGGTGSDLYRFDFGTSAQDVISEAGGNGTDTIQISDLDIEQLSFRRSSNLLVVESVAEPGGKLIIEDHFSGIATNRVEIFETTDGLRFLKTGLTGTSTSDILVGASGQETLNGAAGDDVIAGGGGKDRLTGGGGDDIFVYTSVSDSTALATGRDTILDFTPGSDLLNLSGIDANTGLAGDNAFVFNGFGATSGAGTLAYSFAGGNTLIEADVNGGGADFAVLLAGLVVLDADDFIL